MCLIINTYQGRFLLSVHFSNVGVGDAVGSGPCLLTRAKKPLSVCPSVCENADSASDL